MPGPGCSKTKFCRSAGCNRSAGLHGRELVRHKECIVLDYSETSLVAGWIRDEIRMIEPKFYLGEVFGEKTRLFHFTLQF